MIRYMAVINDGKFDIQAKQELESSVWMMGKKPPEVSYIKLKIRIIGKEHRYAHEGRSKKRKFLIFGKEK